MNLPQTCEQALLAQADFDGEIDAAQAARMEAHRAVCSDCQAQYEDFARLRAALRKGSFHTPAPDSLRRLVAASAEQPTLREVRSSMWKPTVGFGVGALVAATISFLILWPSTYGLVDQMVDDHIRALQPGHLMDVQSSDRHTVKPWFEGRIDFAPPVKDLAGDQFPLIGGRLDYLDGRPVAALVYQHGNHLINLFVWPVARAETVGPTSAVRMGYNVISWRQDGMAFGTVSDLEAEQLAEFVRLWQANF